MQQTGADPASDLLYSNNFAFNALHEAAAATADPKLTAAARLMRDFVVRTQVLSLSLSHTHTLSLFLARSPCARVCVSLPHSH